jgi:hypothetical protein
VAGGECRAICKRDSPVDLPPDLRYYALAVGIGANILNLLMVSVLVGRQRHRARHA